MTNHHSDQPRKKPLAASTMLRRQRYALKGFAAQNAGLMLEITNLKAELAKYGRTLTNQSAARVALQNEVESDNETMRRQEQVICNLRTEIIELRQRVGTDSQKATTVLTKCVKAQEKMIEDFSTLNQLNPGIRPLVAGVEPMATSEAGCIGLYSKHPPLRQPIAPELVKTDEIPGWMQLCGWSALVILLVTFIVAELNLYGVFK